MNFFLIFSNCTLTKGVSRSIISDLQESKLFFIPNELYDILIELKTKPLLEVKNQLDTETQEVFMEYVEYFIDEGIGFYTSSPESFLDFPLEYDTPEIINNAVIDLDEKSTYDINKVIENLIDTQCKFLQIRSYTTIKLKQVEAILKHCSKGYFTNVDFIVKSPEDANYENEAKDLVLNTPLLGDFILHASATNYQDAFIKKTKTVLLNETCCGVINQNNFMSTIGVFTESQHHNSCLHKKISIDSSGNIKNCPSMAKNFGNIKHTTLQEALAQKDFKKYWNITKDQIDVCKTCEFRYICTDCRAYTEDSKNEYSKPLKCGYNPETTKWENWSLNPLKAKSIEVYGMSYLINKNG